MEKICASWNRYKSKIRKWQRSARLPFARLLTLRNPDDQWPDKKQTHGVNWTPIYGLTPLLFLSDDPHLPIPMTDPSTSTHSPAHEITRKPRTLVLCLDGVGDEYGTRVRHFHHLSLGNNRCQTKCSIEHKRGQVVFDFAQRSGNRSAVLLPSVCSLSLSLSLISYNLPRKV